MSGKYSIILSLKLVSIPHSCPHMTGHCDVITPPIEYLDRVEPRLGTPETRYLGSVRLVENRRIGSVTEGQDLLRNRVGHQICGVIRKFFFSNTQDTVVNVTKDRNKVFLMVLVCRGSEGWCN